MMVYLLQEQEAVKGGRGMAHLVLKCKLCARENNLRESLLAASPLTDTYDTEKKTLQCSQFSPHYKLTAYHLLIVLATKLRHSQANANYKAMD